MSARRFTPEFKGEAVKRLGALQSFPKMLSQNTDGLIAGSDMGTHCSDGACILVQGYLHEVLPVDCTDCTSSRRTSRAMNCG